MGAGVHRHRRDLDLPDEPRLGRRRALRPASRTPGTQLHPRGRLPARRRRVRPGAVRYLAARGRGDGPAAAAAAGDELGGVRAGRAGPDRPAWQRHRRVRRRDVPRLRHGRRRYGAGRGGLPADRHHGERAVRAGGLHLRPARPGGDAGHGVLVVAGGAAPGRSGAAAGGVLAGAGRRRDRDVDAEHLRGVQPAARAGSGRALQVLRRRRRRHRLVRRCGPAAVGAAVGRAPERASGAGGAPWVGGELRRRE